MSEEFNQIKEDLKKINELMGRIVENWEKLNDEEFHKLSKNYPSYLPSFNEFQSDLNSWLNSLLDNSKN